MTLLTNRRRTVTADSFAAVTLVIAGGLAVIGFVLSWKTDRISAQSTGWDYVRLVLSQGAGTPAGQKIAAYGVLATAVAGGALILLGLSTLLPLTHQPLGAVALMLGLGIVAATVWWTYQQARSEDDVFGQLAVGWYLVAISGPVALVGAIRALSRPD